jgi:hypothetical protein
VTRERTFASVRGDVRCTAGEPWRLLVCAIGIACAPAVAAAQPSAPGPGCQPQPITEPLDELSLAPQSLALRGSLGYFSIAEPGMSLNVSTLRASADYAFDARWSIAADLGLVLLESSPHAGSSDLALRPANPTLWGYYRAALFEGSYRLGLGGAAPLATLDDDGNARLQRAALNYASGMNGLWELWLWATDRGAVILRAELEERLVDKTWVLLAFTPALMLPARSAFGDHEADLLLPIAASLGARHRVMWFGLRGQAVFMPTVEPDGLQLALGPWARVVSGSLFFELLVLGNVDEPLAGARGLGVWGLHLSVGGMP